MSNAMSVTCIRCGLVVYTEQPADNYVCSFCKEKEEQQERKPRPLPPGWVPRSANGEYTIEQLKTMPYKQYCATTYWWRLKKERIKNTGGCCEKCGKKIRRQFHLHHFTYEHRGEELPEDLILLCRKCHEEMHGRAFANRPPSDAKVFRDKLRSMGIPIPEALRAKTVIPPEIQEMVLNGTYEEWAKDISLHGKGKAGYYARSK